MLVSCALQKLHLLQCIFAHHYYVMLTVSTFTTALHQERVSHVLTSPDGLNNPHGLPEDIDLKFLESDLTFQVDLLRDKLAVEHMQEGSMPAYGNPYSSTVSMPGFVGDLDGESREAAMICLVIAGMVLLPQLLGA